MSDLPQRSSEVLLPLTQPTLVEMALPVAGASSMQTRLWSGLVFSLCGLMLGLGAWMTPSAKGIGTHAENFHLPPCGFYVATGLPCPTCGCTTAVTWAAHGHLVKAFVVQPFGGAVAVVAIGGLLLGFLGMLTGRWMGPSLFFVQWHWARLLIGGGVILVLGWAYKIYAMGHGF